MIIYSELPWTSSISVMLHSQGYFTEAEAEAGIMRGPVGMELR